MDKIKIHNSILIKSYKECENVVYTRNSADSPDKLDGILISGMELNDWTVPNVNNELYDKFAFDEFINEYFINNGLNMPVTLQHSSDIDDVIGKVLKCEVSDEGLLFDVYLPKTFTKYNQAKALLNENMLSFSKEGYATDYEFINDNAGHQVMKINKMSITSLSLVTTPANPNPLADVIENALKFENICGRKRASNQASNQAPVKNELDILFGL